MRSKFIAALAALAICSPLNAQSIGGNPPPTGTGTVTSVGISPPSIFTAGAPVTTSGSVSFGLASQTANQIFAAPNGAAGAPTFRGLVTADIPTGTSGASIPLTNGANTWSNSQTFNGTNTFGAANTFSGANSFTNSNTFTGPQTITATGSDVQSIVNASPGNYATFRLTKSNKGRWDINADNTAESGSNAGTNFSINRFDDTGAYIGTPFTINRATGAVGIGAPGLANSSLSNMAAGTVKANTTGASAAPSDVTLAALDLALPYKCANILDYGGNPGGSVDNAAAFAAAVAAASPYNICVYFPAGSYLFNSTPGVTMGSSYAYAGLTIKGDGSELTRFSYGSANLNGLNIQLNGANQSFHIRDISFLAPNNSGSNQGILINQGTGGGTTGSAMQSDISNVVLRGSDGYHATNQWSQNITLQNVSNVNFINDAIFGGNGSQPYGTTGIGINIGGTSSQLPIQFDILGTQINFVGQGLYYGNYTQGISISGSNFTGDNYGIYQDAAQVGAAQLSVVSSQFNCGHHDIFIGSLNVDVDISANDFYLAAAGTAAIEIAKPVQFTVVGNSFQTLGTSQAGTAMTVGPNNAQGGVVSGNQFQQFITGVWLQTSASAQNVNVQGNSYFNTGTQVLNQGTGNSVGVATK